jgi:acyl-[acyl-carrier-protein] desaturase
MMKQKIVMPAHFLRESGEKISTAFEQFFWILHNELRYTPQQTTLISCKKLMDKGGNS